MSRWEPNARGRLERAAYELFLDRGYEQTTVAAIAERAGVTERTFFRHYADKREVFFGGTSALQDEMLRALDAVPAGVPPIEAVRLAVEAMSAFMRVRRDLARQRQRIVAQQPDLQERGLIKRARLTAALAEGLLRRGVPETTANLAADMGMAVFHVGFARWVDEAEERELVDVVREGFEQLKTVASAG